MGTFLPIWLSDKAAMLAALVLAAILLAGLVAYPLLPVAPLPQIDFPTIAVTGSLPGASPETMASSVAQPLERQIAQIPGVSQMTSTSSLGATAITVQFDLDRNIDAKVERTRNRPLASGRISGRAAALFLGAQVLVGLAVLLCFNGFTIALAPASLAIVAVYPLMKRVTFWPQAVLGLAFAYGGLMGWAAAMGALAWPAVLIYAAAIAWTIAYDTIYALQDARDDAVIGVRSTARLFGGQVRLGVALFYGAAVIFATAAVVLAGGGALALAGVAAFALHLAWQVALIDAAVPARALRLFRSNRDAGLVLFAGLALQGLLG